MTAELQGQILLSIKSLLISFKVGNDKNMQKSQRDVIPPIIELCSLLNRPMSLPLIALRFAKETSNHIKCFIFLSLLILTQKVMNTLIREKSLQMCENSAVFIRISPPEASLSTVNLSCVFGFLIKVCSGFFSKCIGHSALMKTSHGQIECTLLSSYSVL